MSAAYSAVNSDHPVTWRRFKYPDSLYRYGFFLITVVFVLYSFEYLNIHVSRFFTMYPRLSELLFNRYYPPDIPHVLNSHYLSYLVESIMMALLGTILGIFLSIPLSWFASYNMSPSRKFLYPLARLFLMLTRSVHEMIWTILFVTILGYGMLPGVLALTLFSIGFTGKLFSEEIEAILKGQVEAIQATGANSLKVFVYAVIPQVKVAWTGIGIYTWDAAFRAATVLGFFGAGGMGWYLKRAVQQIQHDRVAAILLSIIALVVLSEILSAYARNKVATQ